jgi:hypothetical protein
VPGVELDEQRVTSVRDSGDAAPAIELAWNVELCADGTEAMKIIASSVPYNILSFDYSLPGHNGIELTRHARTLSHRRPTYSRPVTSNRTLGALARARFYYNRTTWAIFPKRSRAYWAKILLAGNEGCERIEPDSPEGCAILFSTSALGG